MWTFVSRGFSIPRQAEWEGIHFFDDVRAILGPATGAPARPESEPVELMSREDESAAGGEPADTPPQSPPPPVDVEDLQPPE